MIEGRFGRTDRSEGQAAAGEARARSRKRATGDVGEPAAAPRAGTAPSGHEPGREPCLQTLPGDSPPSVGQHEHPHALRLAVARRTVSTGRGRPSASRVQDASRRPSSSPAGRSPRNASVTCRWPEATTRTPGRAPETSARPTGQPRRPASREAEGRRRGGGAHCSPRLAAALNAESSPVRVRTRAKEMQESTQSPVHGLAPGRPARRA